MKDTTKITKSANASSSYLAALRLAVDQCEGKHASRYAQRLNNYSVMGGCDVDETLATCVSYPNETTQWPMTELPDMPSNSFLTMSNSWQVVCTRVGNVDCIKCFLPVAQDFDRCTQCLLWQWSLLAVANITIEPHQLTSSPVHLGCTNDHHTDHLTDPYLTNSVFKVTYQYTHLGQPASEVMTFQP